MTKDTENKRFTTILLFGPPGSGKGTIGEVLAKEYGHLHISSGDLFRNIDPNSEPGRVFQSYASKGQLVPDDVTVEIIEKQIDSFVEKGQYDPNTQILLFDGFPRTKAQAIAMEKRFSVVEIVLLEIHDPKILFERIEGRAKAQGRHDDKSEEVLRKRLEVYEKQTLDAISHYPKNLICHIDGTHSKEAVLEAVKAELKHILSKT